MTTQWESKFQTLNTLANEKHALELWDLKYGQEAPEAGEKALAAVRDAVVLATGAPLQIGLQIGLRSRELDITFRGTDGGWGSYDLTAVLDCPYGNSMRDAKLTVRVCGVTHSTAATGGVLTPTRAWEHGWVLLSGVRLSASAMADHLLDILHVYVVKKLKA